MKLSAVAGLAVLSSIMVATAVAEVPRSSWAKLNDINLHYLDLGKGTEALIFVHGWTCNSDFWRASIGEFPSRRVLALDLPGHGLSDRPMMPYTMRVFADSIAAVMQDAGVQKAVLVGHSMGTPVIREFARAYAERTLALVLVDGALRMPLNAQQRDEYVKSMSNDFENAAPGAIAHMVEPIEDEDLRKTIARYMLMTPEHVAVGAMRGMVEEKNWRTDPIEVPVLAILAASPNWKADEGDFFRSIAPDLEFQLWPDVSHFLMMERPAAFNAEIARFLGAKNLLQR